MADKTKINFALSPDRFGVRLPDKAAGPLRADDAKLPRDPIEDAIRDAKTRE